MSLHIRTASYSEDVALICTLWRAYSATLQSYGVWDLGGETIEPDLARLSRGEGWDHWRIYLAFSAEGAIAIGGFTPLPHLGAGVAEGRRLYVVPSHRGSGVARALLAACERDARAEGFHTLYLDTFRTPEGEGPRKLYRSLGFTECAPYNDYPPERAWFMVKQLAA